MAERGMEAEDPKSVCDLCPKVDKKFMLSK
jgi:hypothetical protein